MSDTALVLRVKAIGDSSELLAPSVGVFTPTIAVGELVTTGQSIGTIDVLGVQRALVVPDGVAGKVTQRLGGSRSRVPAQHGDALITVSTAAVGEVSADSLQSSADAASALSFTAPMSGRFYSRPSPTEPAFVSVGDTVTDGQTVGLLEVMKTFNRLVYQGDGLPDRATVERIVPNDGDDVVRGDPILLLGADEG
jgi:acetyl-CoA carboxylase biotin carboxyl carrier protein